MKRVEIARAPSGIPGMDLVTGGGLPEGRLTLVVGTAGSGKTLLAVQFLADGIARGEKGVFVTFEERPSAIKRNFKSFGWDVGAWEERGDWAFVDAAPNGDEETIVAGEYDLASLVVRVRHAVERTGATRLAIDSTGSLIEQIGTVGAARRALFQIGHELERLGVTSVMTAERPEDYGPISRFGFEEFVADNVVILRNALEGEKRRRTAEVLKLRGGSHLKGEHLFTVVAEQGLVVLPQEVADFGYPTSTRRLTSGIAELDAMSGGGFFDKSLVLVTGATGTGKSLVSSHFISGAEEDGERALFYSFEESRAQLGRNAAAWGIDFDRLEAEGKLRVIATAPEAQSLEDHLLRMKVAIDEFRPDRVAIDSLTALQRIATARSFREYLLGLTFHIKSEAMIGLMTAAEDLRAGLSHGGLHMSTVADTIVALQYVGAGTSIGRAVAVLKMRGSDHDKHVREYVVDGAGMQIGEPIEVRWTQLGHVL